GAIRDADLDIENTPDFLREYQRFGVAWLRSITSLDCHPLLADDMGLGKTVQVLAMLCGTERLKRKDKHPDIIVCPASVVPVWEQELVRWFPDRTARILGRQGFNPSSKEKAPDLWICSYTQLRRNRALLSGCAFRYAVLDEAQYIKNPDAKVSQACYAIRANYRIAMTGTPVENKTEDLWALFRYLMPGILGSRREFNTKLDSDERFDYVEKLRRQIQPFILRRTRDVVAPDLPPKMEIQLACPLTPAQRSEYSRLTSEGVEKLGEQWDAVTGKGTHFFTLLTRLRQVCCDPALLPGNEFNIDNSGKIEVLVRRVSEAMETSRKVVIFSQFVKLLNHVKSALKGVDSRMKIWSLTGQTSDRAKPVEQFQKNAGAGVILVSLRAGGTGITLHSADTVFLMDPWWNPAVEAQAVDRIHRIGQDKPVFVYRMVAVGTIEEKIERLKLEKRKLFDEVVPDGNDTQGWVDAFSDLRSLIDLNDVSVEN
ncbi:MAG: DEAD/DEAH box helicase, partial [Verrucomicrobiota bacterium]